MARRGDVSRQALRWRCAAGLDDHLDGSTSANGNLTNLVDHNRLEATGTWLGKYVYFPTGGLSGIERRVVSFFSGSVLGLWPTLSVSLASGTIYEIHQRSVRHYNGAIERAEAWARQIAYLPMVATLSWLGSDTYKYTLAALSLDYIHDVRHEYVAGDWHSLRGPNRSGGRPQWRIEHGDNPLLVFERNRVELGASGGVIEIHGSRRPIPMAQDSDTCELHDDVILEVALMYLSEQNMSANDAEAYAARRDRAQALMDRFAADLPNVPSNSVPILRY